MMAKEKNGVSFTRVSFGGYKTEEVDEYIASLTVELEGQRAKVGELTDKLRYLVRVVEEMQKSGVAAPAAPAPAPAVDDGAEKAAKLLSEIRAKLTQTSEALCALLGAELAEYAEMAEALAAKKEEAPAEKEPEIPSAPAEPAAPAEAESRAESLSFDTMSFESLRKDIDDLAAEKYIPGQEEPTIVADDLQSIVIRPVDRSGALPQDLIAAAEAAVRAKGDISEMSVSPAQQPEKLPVPEESVPQEVKTPEPPAEDGDDDVHFSLFHRR